MTGRDCRKRLSQIAGKIGLICVLLGSACPLWAQEQKPTPPPSRLPSVPDTTAIGEKPKPQPAAAERSKLELPDVLIVGEDRTKRMAGEKVYARAVPVELHEQQVVYEPVRIRVDEEANKAFSKRPFAVPLWGVEALATYGDYRWLRGQAIHWAQREGWSYQISGTADRTDGQYDYSARSRYQLRGQVGVGGRGPGRLGASASVGKHDLELNIRDVRRSATDLSVGGEFSTATGRATLYLRGTTDMLWLQQEAGVDLGTGFPTIWKARASRSSVEAGLEWQVGPAIVHAGLRFLGDRFRFSDRDTSRAQNDLSALVLEVNLPVAERASLAVGGALETLKETGQQRVSRAFLSARAAATLTPFLGVFGEFRSGYRPVNPVEIWSWNPYFHPLFTDWSTERIQPAVSVGGELKLVSGSRVRMRWGRSYIYGAHYWQRLPARGTLSELLYAYHALPKVERNEVSLGVDFAPAPDVDASVDLVQVSEELESSYERAMYPGFTRRPFLAHWRLPLRIQWRPTSGLRIGLTGAWVGSRPEDLQGRATLPAYTVLDAEVEVGVARNVMIRFETRNLTNENIVLWPGHPEFGRVLALGVHGVW